MQPGWVYIRAALSNKSVDADTEAKFSETLQWRRALTLYCLKINENMDEDSPDSSFQG